MEKLYKFVKHHAAHLRELCHRNEHTDQLFNKKSQKFEIGQTVMVKNQT